MSRSITSKSSSFFLSKTQFGRKIFTSTFLAHKLPITISKNGLGFHGSVVLLRVRVSCSLLFKIFT